MTRGHANCMQSSHVVCIGLYCLGSLTGSDRVYMPRVTALLSSKREDRVIRTKHIGIERGNAAYCQSTRLRRAMACMALRWELGSPRSEDEAPLLRRLLLLLVLPRRLLLLLVLLRRLLPRILLSVLSGPSLFFESPLLNMMIDASWHCSRLDQHADPWRTPTLAGDGSRGPASAVRNATCVNRWT